MLSSAYWRTSCSLEEFLSRGVRRRFHVHVALTCAEFHRESSSMAEKEGERDRGGVVNSTNSGISERRVNRRAL